MMGAVFISLADSKTAQNPAYRNTAKKMKRRPAGRLFTFYVCLLF
jgi:hypothetical protein